MDHNSSIFSKRLFFWLFYLQKQIIEIWITQTKTNFTSSKFQRNALKCNCNSNQEWKNWFHWYYFATRKWKYLWWKTRMIVWKENHLFNDDKAELVIKKPEKLDRASQHLADFSFFRLELGTLGCRQVFELSFQPFKFSSVFCILKVSSSNFHQFSGRQ